MIDAVHLLLYSRDAAADRAFLRDVLGWPYVADTDDDEWLIFQVPPGEAGVHPTDGEPSTEMYLMTRDVEALATRLTEAGVAVSERADRGWGVVASITLPSGMQLGVYEPRHPTAYDL